MAAILHFSHPSFGSNGLFNVLVATDFGGPADAAFDYARGIARAFGARLHLLHVVSDVDAVERRPVDAEQEVLERLRGMLDDELRSFATETVVMKSHHPAAAILRYAHEAKIDLIVLGTHGRTGFGELFMGSVAQEVVRRAECPVLTMRGGSPIMREAASAAFATPVHA